MDFVFSQRVAGPLGSARGTSQEFRTASIISTSKGSSGWKELMRDMVDPGFAGIASELEYFYHYKLVGPAAARRKVQFKSTGAWNNIPLSSSTAMNTIHSGVYESSNIKLPIEVRLMVNSTVAAYGIFNVTTSTGLPTSLSPTSFRFAAMRIKGTVTT